MKFQQFVKGCSQI